jgi:hypothetical protein
MAGTIGKGICAGASSVLRVNSSPSAAVLSRWSHLLSRSLLQTVHTEFFLSQYIKILGARTLSLATFARCHCTQELFRMKWACAPRNSWALKATEQELTVSPHGNWETADGKRFFCQWVSADKDSMSRDRSGEPSGDHRCWC